MKEAILIAGANGSGKTTFARELLPLLHPGVPFLNADEIQREAPQFGDPLSAAREFLKRLDTVARVGRNFAVETTLSSRSYVSRIESWHRAQYSSVLHFIEVPSADFAVARVRRSATFGADSSESLVHVWYHWSSDDHGLQLIARHVQS